MTETPVIVPDTGIESTRIWIERWHVGEGGFAKKGAIIVTLETPELNNDFKAQVSGSIHLLAPEKAEVKIGQSIAIIRSAD